MKQFIFVALALALSVFPVEKGFSATLDVHEVDPLDDTVCQYTLRGEIEAGDAAKFEGLGGTSYGMTLCLNSPGGSLGEALRIFDKVWQANLRTMVMPGEECLSSCALIFLGGSLLEGTDVTRQMDRTLWVGGDLGFHGPARLMASGEAVDPAEVERSFGTALLAATRLFELNRISDRGRRPMTDHLLHQWLRTPFEQMYTISTIGDAILTDIPVAGLRYPDQITDEHLSNVCNSVSLRGNFPEAGGRSATIIKDFTDTSELWKRVSQDYFFTERRFHRQKIDGIEVAVMGPYFSATKYYVLGCRVSVDPKGVAEFNARSYYYGDYPISVTIFAYEQEEELPSHLRWTANEREELSDSLPPLYLYPMDMPLASAAKSSVARAPVADSAHAAVVPTFTQIKGRDLRGGDLTMIRLKSGTDPTEALDICAGMAECVAVTVDRWNALAFLKSSGAFAQGAEVQPKADSYIKPTHMTLYRADLREKVIRRRADKAFQGHGYQTLERVEYDQCARLCLADENCNGFNHDMGRRECALFDRPPEYFTRKGFQIGLKLQEP